MPSQMDRNDLGKSFGCFVRWIARWGGEMKSSLYWSKGNEAKG